MENDEELYSELMHYGTKYHSGRYPYGSGEDPYQHDGGLRGFIKDGKDYGLTEVQIAEAAGFKSTTEMRRRATVEKMEERNKMYAKCYELHEKGFNNTEIAKKLGLPGESSVRSYLNPKLKEKNDIGMSLANTLKAEIDAHGATDVGSGMTARLGVNDSKLETAIILLERQGYKTWNIPVKQQGTGKITTVRVIAPKDQDWKETRRLVADEGKIHIINDTYSEDGGRTWENIEPPRSISSKRILVKYDEDGGTLKDGLIEVRPGVEDLDMGRNQYCQVRIAVDGDKYMKGMAIYNNNIPEGYDVIYNSNKSRNHPEKVFKAMKDDPNNPFGSTIKNNEYDDEGNILREVGQRHYIDKNGKKQLSAVNIVREEGDWSDWKKSLASQMLSKQSPELAERQLNLAYEKKVREFEEISSLTNTAIQDKLLRSFSDDCDAAAVHLKAAALPGQQSHVIIPVPEIKDGEIYAPNYPNGTVVSLIRYPHGGIFEIPTLTVNNKIKPAKDLLGNAKDAVGINAKTAMQLSGADFDGDSVTVIPNPKGKLIRSRPYAEALKNFDTISNYGHDAFGPEVTWKEVKTDKGFREQLEMGKISNLITDMTLKGASEDEIIRATKHSMVIIDAEKHDLNWRQSYEDQGIKELKKKYQPAGGVSTIVSRAKNETRIPERKQLYDNMIDKETGEIKWKETGKTKKEKNKETGVWEQTDKPVLQKSTQMADALTKYGDAYSLVSSPANIMEMKYADYATKMHQLANDARKKLVNLKNMPYSASAAKTYKNEVDSILQKLNNALKNKPLERKAQALAGAQYKIWLENNPDADKEEQKKHKNLFLVECRKRMGSSKSKINLTKREWEAIQAGAITHSRFLQILNNTDVDVVKDYATPRDYSSKLGKSELALAKSMMDSGRYTQADVAEYLGVSVSTINRALNA